MSVYAEVKEGRTIYLELHGRRNLVYRVIARTHQSGERQRVIYGVEAAHSSGWFREELEDFSEHLENAAAFAKYLLRRQAPPGTLYTCARDYLRAGGRR